LTFFFNGGGSSHQRDAKNRLKSVDNGTNGTFTYNAYGWRVYNSSGSVSYLLDPSGQFLGGVWSGVSNSLMFMGSRMLASAAIIFPNRPASR
jgi:hypothetical protein